MWQTCEFASFSKRITEESGTACLLSSFLSPACYLSPTTLFPPTFLGSWVSLHQYHGGLFRAFFWWAWVLVVWSPHTFSSFGVSWLFSTFSFSVFLLEYVFLSLQKKKSLNCYIILRKSEAHIYSPESSHTYVWFISFISFLWMLYC